MQNKVAIIGSDSFLAGYLIDELDDNFHITGFSRRNGKNLPNHVVFDYPQNAIKVSDLLHFDIIVYCAGSGIQSGLDVDLIYPLNTFIPIEIAAFLSKNQYKGVLITFGSYFEIGSNSQERSFTEEEVINSSFPVPNSYCTSKRLLTKFIQSENLLIKHYHFILPTIFGKGENKNRLIPYLVSSLINNKEPSLTSGYQTRQYIHARDVAKIIANILQKTHVPSGIYNMPSKETILIKDLVSQIYRKLEKNQTAVTISKYDETMKFLALNANKLNVFFENWVTELAVIDCLEEYM